MSDEIETAIFRVVQECLTNIHRHSGSFVARVHVRRFKKRIVVGMADRGKGIPPEKMQEIISGGIPGVGIRGMRERLRQLGGDLQLHSSVRGTVVTATVPLEETAPKEETPSGASSLAAA
jgi:two-component system, NarL family, sensor kinase